MDVVSLSFSMRDMLQALNILILPAFWFIVRIHVRLTVMETRCNLISEFKHTKGEKDVD